LALLLTRDVEPNVSFSRLVVAMDQGQPSFKLVVELVSASHDSATRQINRLQDALDRAGFRTINVDSDGPPRGLEICIYCGSPGKRGLLETRTIT